MKKYALLSVSDKSGILELASNLIAQGYSILATGNTSKLLKANNIDVNDVSDYTGFPEVFDGRVKTLNPKIFGGILYRRDLPEDINTAEKHEISPIDIVCVNLYPFKKTIDNPESSFDTIIENIDIGGPSLIRAAAKNYKNVCVLTDPSQYKDFCDALNNNTISLELKQKLATKAFAHTSKYDTIIADYFENKFEIEDKNFRINLPVSNTLRYGENPHQQAAIYGDFNNYFEILHGKALSYNNILDLVAAVELVQDMDENSCAIIKHNNPAGAATANNVHEAYNKALQCDPASAYGGIVVVNNKIDKEFALKLNEIFLEIVCAPDFTEDAIEILFKKRDRRILKQLKKTDSSINYKNIPGGVLVQSFDNITLDKNNLKVVTTKQPTEQELEDLIFAWTISKHTKSNAIVFVKDKMTLGVGAGQMSRVDSAKIAEMKSIEHKLNLKDSVAASDAFFPFADGLLEIIKCGATAVIQPGGSIRDKEVIEAANNNNISMVFTGIRHFKH